MTRLKLLLAIIPIVAYARQPAETVPSSGGLVVEDILPVDSGPAFGLQIDDVIVSWSSQYGSGGIGSPLDWWPYWNEQFWRGTVRLKGYRNAKPKEWVVNDVLPSLILRPAMRPELDLLWRNAATLDKKYQYKDAEVAWSLLKANLQPGDPYWMTTLTCIRRAKSLGHLRRYLELDQEMKMALQSTSQGGGHNDRYTLLSTWGGLKFDRGDLAQAQELYVKALEQARLLPQPGMKVGEGLEHLSMIAIAQGNLGAAAVLSREVRKIHIAMVSAGPAFVRDFKRSASLAFYGGHLREGEEDELRALESEEEFNPDSLGVAYIFHELGEMARGEADFAKAESYFRKAIAIDRELNPGGMGVSGAAKTLSDVCLIQGDLRHAEEFAKEAVFLARKNGTDQVKLADALTSMANVERDAGDVAAAQKDYEEAASIRLRIDGGKPGVESIQSAWDLGTAAAYRSDWSRAEHYFLTALDTAKTRQPNGSGTARILDELGNLALVKSNPDLAERYLNEALAIKQRIDPEGLETSVTLERLGYLAENRGDKPTAQAYFERGYSIRKRLAKGTLSESNGLSDLAYSALLSGDLAKAKTLYKDELSIELRLAPDSWRVAQTLTHLSAVCYSDKDFDAALTYARSAVSIADNLSKELGLPFAQHLMGIALLQKKESKAALPLLRRAVEQFESRSKLLAGTEQEKERQRAQASNLYSDLEFALLDQKQQAAAYAVSERYRARLFLKMLAERDLSTPFDLTPETARVRRRNLIEYDKVQAQFESLSPTKDLARINLLIGKLRDLTAEREAITEQIKKSSPRFAALEYPVSLDLPQTQKLLDPGTTLLSYVVSPSRTMFFMVSSAGEPRYATLNIKEADLRAKILDLRGLIKQRVGPENSTFRALSTELYNMLIKGAEVLFPNTQRFLIVPDGPLNLLPFAALMRNNGQFFVEWKPIHTVVSATVYSQLIKARHAQREDKLELVAFGDPNPAAETNAPSTRDSDPELHFAAERGFKFARLPFSRDEVEAITSLFPKRSLAYLDFQATEERAKALGKDIRYIHFAAHGLLDEKLPLNSAIVLTIPDHISPGQDNGLLQAWEVFDQMRIDAELVTLSACNTGLGQEMSGEGMIGLTRAFHFAGARSVLSSFWSVDDFRTMQLMQRFYKLLKSGITKDEALRQAQMSLIHGPGSSSPYYWAAFELSGDWK